jgi:hypothetical protein
MKRTLLWMVALAVLAVVVGLCAPPSHADTAPAFSIQRVLVTAGADYARYDDLIVASGRKWELKPSLNVAYNLGTYSSLVTSYSRGIDTKRNEYRVGIRIRLFNGKKEAGQ